MQIDLSTVPRLYAPLADLIHAVAEARSPAGPSGKRITRQEVGAIVVAVGKLVVAVGEEIAG